MAETYKVLGQSNPVAVTLTDIYTVPGATSANISNILACNQSSSEARIRVAVAIAGAANATKQYLLYDYIIGGFASVSLPIARNFSFVPPIGITLAATDVLRVQSTTGMVSFNVFGVEIT